MNELSIYEALDLIRTNEMAIFEILQVWISLTFATIVAAFLGQRFLTRTMRFLAAGLYLLASAALWALVMHFVQSNGELAAALEALGAPQSAPVLAGRLYLCLIVLSIVSTLYFLFRQNHDDSGGDAL